MKNYNCDNDYCKYANGEIRVLPIGGDSNALLCKACYEHEILFRRDLNEDLGDSFKFKLPAWEDLKIYEPGK